MYALKIRINEEAAVIAGADDLGVLNAMVNCVGKLGVVSSTARTGDSPDFFLSLGGLTSRSSGISDEHMHWIANQRLLVGDVIRLELVEAMTSTKPLSNEHVSNNGYNEREFFEHCKRYYFALREKYEVWEEEGGRVRR